MNNPRATARDRTLAQNLALKCDLARCTREGNDVADVIDTRGIHHGAFEAQTETCVWHCSIAAQIALPRIRFLLHLELVEAAIEVVQALFALATTDDFADSGH